ncbi:uncharacterized protein LOC110687004 [Chenopodium quinoa]|uniref:uncharacterized protein LOC110687004 n=1 Tax=Chenopodium quinoa TaxID=63459 RepID=UPI000B770B69|nr:uncharacterized protein LOC110687004 [Chenopodium quinoa]
MTTLKHFTHQCHPLKEISEDNEFKCDGCEMLGIGQRYQCKECSFNLHMHCGHCPANLCSFMHPKHRLHLTLVQRSRASFSNKHACEVCGKGVGGLFYHCKRCEIYVHPLCSQLPQYVHYITDVEHNLELQCREKSNSCTVCGGYCSHWYYKCGKCPIILHIDCLLSKFLLSRPLPLQKKKPFSWSSQKKRSTVAWWWFCVAFVMVLHLLHQVMGSQFPADHR